MSKMTKDKFGNKQWLNSENELHREDGPARIYPDGTEEWRLNDELHREDGPAVEFPSGTKYWLINGKLHREDGPAMVWKNGFKYYLNNVEYTEEDYKMKIRLKKLDEILD
jgi:hypothetical protein